MPKNYAVAVKEDPLAMRRRADAVVIFRDPGPVLSRAFDFRRFGLPSEIEGSLADGYFEYCRDKSEATRYVSYNILKHFAKFILEIGLDDSKGDPMTHYASYLERQRMLNGDFWTSKRCHWHYSQTMLILKVLKHRLGAEWLSATDLPGLPYRRKRARTSRRGLELSEQDARRIVEAAQKEIQGVRERIGPFIPRSDDIIPYIIAIGSATFGNSGTLRNLQRDCLIPHPVDDRRTVVVWFKPRSQRHQHRTFIDQAQWSPPMLIREVLILTEPVLRFVSQKDADKLFICNKPKNGTPFNMGTLGQCALDAATERFIQRNSLPPFRMSMMRLAGLAHSYRTLGGDIRKVQFLANHSHPATTREYVDTYINSREDEAIIAELQLSFQAAFITSLSDPKVTARTLDVDVTTANSMAIGANATMSGFTCKNPLAGIAPGQKAGQICTHWLGCFSCPNAVVTGETKSIARLLQLSEHLSSAMGGMHVERWRQLYMPIVAIIQRDILPKFSDGSIALAKALLPTLPFLPEILNR